MLLAGSFRKGKLLDFFFSSSKPRNEMNPAQVIIGTEFGAGLSIPSLARYFCLTAQKREGVARTVKAKSAKGEAMRMMTTNKSLEGVAS